VRLFVVADETILVFYFFFFLLLLSSSSSFSSGMHTTQGAVASLAEVLWTKLEKDHPEFLGAVNPNNDKIEAMFGDQGGY
jgi:hypothetical protein